MLVWGLGAVDVWSPAENLSQTQAPERSIQAVLAQSSSSRDLWAVWTDEGPGEEGEIRGRRWERATQSWLPGLAVPAEDLSQSEWVDKGPMVFFDQQGQAHLLWTRRMAQSQGAPADATELLWRVWDGSAWSPETVLLHNNSYFPGNYGMIPVETVDSILLILTFDVGYRLAEYQSGSWSAFSAWDYLDYALADAVMDEAGLLHAAAFGENSSQVGYDSWFYDGYYLIYDGISWTQGMNLSGTRGVAHELALTFDSQGNLHFLWSDPDSPYSSESLKSALWERVWNGSTWSDNAEVTAYNTDQAIDSFSLAASVSGTLHLAWSEGLFVNNAHTDLDICYQIHEGSAWSSEQAVYTSTLDSHDPSLVAGDGEVSLLWQVGPLADQDVYFARQVVPGTCVDLGSVALEGPMTGTVGLANTFVASASPLTATWPLTYTWQASEQPSVVHTGGFVDMVDFTWATTGTKSVTVTAENCGAVVTAVHSIFIEPVQYYYLPWVLKEGTP